MALVSCASWITAHGAALGGSAALAAVTAAASLNALAAPLGPRLLSALGGASLMAVVVGLIGWITGA
jgi:hypothetical protein